MELVAVSYDSPETLAAFAEDRGIVFPLLSDPGSRTIDAFGVRNQEEDEGRTRGIPHPGTVLIDSEGRIRGKLFYTGYMARHDPDAILAEAALLDRPARPQAATLLDDGGDASDGHP